jgi:hypothetical protein
MIVGVIVTIITVAVVVILALLWSPFVWLLAGPALMLLIRE